MQADSSTGLATVLPDHNILTYDVIAYCPPGQAAASCALSTVALKVRMRMRHGVCVWIYTN